jgi:hypothetical protein
MKLKSILLTAVATLGLTAVAIAQNLPSYLPTSGLVGWWPFNGNANDESGNELNGNVINANLTSDRLGNTNSAFDFNFTGAFFGQQNQEIYIPYNPVMNVSNITVSYWIYPRSYYWASNPNLTVNITRFQYGYSNPNGQVWGIGYTDNQILCGLNGSNGNGTYQAILNSAINLNTWNQIAMTFDGAAIKLFVNGSLVASTPHSIPMNTSGNSGISIGENNSANGFWQHTDGVIDDIGIWNRALTSAEITALYTGVPTDNNETSNTTTNVPDAISYQGIVRDALGVPLADTNVQIRFTLIADSLAGSEEYEETHTLSTNSLGLFTTAFGVGTPVSNTFGNINWSAGNKYLKVQIDTGNGLVDMGTQQLLSTPYSLYSAKAGEIKNPGLPVYSDNAAALAAGLLAGDMYRTSTGVLMVVY